MAHIILIGPPGSGKSAVGRALADLLGEEFSDSDAAIVAREGRAIADIFVDSGESYFRSVEAEVVQELIQSKNGVLSLGGGAVIDSNTQAAIERAKSHGVVVVFLTITLTTAVERIGLNKERPMLLINPRQQWSSLLQARIGIYESLASLTFATDGRSAEDVAAEIAQSTGGVHA